MASSGQRVEVSMKTANSPGVYLLLSSLSTIHKAVIADYALGESLTHFGWSACGKPSQKSMLDFTLSSKFCEILGNEKCPSMFHNGRLFKSENSEEFLGQCHSAMVSLN